MRLFAAVVPPDIVLDEIEALVAPLRKDPRLRWTPREMWHVTTAFYGPLDDFQLRELCADLEHAAERSDLGPLRFANATEFNGKTLVLEVAGETTGLSALAERCTAAGRAAGITMEHRRYRPHLTIGRSARPRDLSAHVMALMGARTVEWQPDELLLFDSHTGERPRYEPVAAWPL